jgi:hypothetical protein
MPQDTRALTRAARARAEAKGEKYTEAREAVIAIRALMDDNGWTYAEAEAWYDRPRMNRDTVPSGAAVAVMFGELMVAGKRAAIGAPDLTAATAAVAAAIKPLWPHATPEAVRDVMMTCVELAHRNGTTLPAGIEDTNVAGLLELAAGWHAAGNPDPPQSPAAPPVAFASSVAFDRDEDAETFGSVALLLALAHLGGPGHDAVGEYEPDDEYDDGYCPECGAAPGYTCNCCPECGAHGCDECTRY